MNRRKRMMGQLRRAGRVSILWGGWLLCIASIVALAASFRWTIQFFDYESQRSWGVLGAQRGAIRLWWTNKLSPGSAQMASLLFVPPPINPWWFDWKMNATGGHITAPLWTPAAAGLAIGIGAIVAGRRPKRGHCRCGYDLSGLAPGAPCPECGRRIDARAARSA